jgi:hypothetical protein
MATYEQMKAQFLNLNQKLAFVCIDPKNPTNPSDITDQRLAFVDALDKRRAEPWRINQRGANLCGPACFMLSIAKEDPDEYGKFVLGLAMHGEGKIGGLTARPENAGKVELFGKIAPVDWVALAGIRDDSGSQMTSVGTGIGGMTLGAPLKRWFDETGMFREVHNYANGVFGASGGSLDGLLKINEFGAGYACLLLRARIVRPSMSGNVFTADHWVLMVDSNCNPDKDIEIKLPSGLPEKPTPLGSEIVTNDFTERFSQPPQIDEAKRKKREELEAGTLNFSVYTWGGIQTIDGEHSSPLTVKKFLGDYFGFVLAVKR